MTKWCHPLIIQTCSKPGQRPLYSYCKSLIHVEVKRREAGGRAACKQTKRERLTEDGHVLRNLSPRRRGTRCVLRSGTKTQQRPVALYLQRLMWRGDGLSNRAAQRGLQQEVLTCAVQFLGSFFQLFPNCPPALINSWWKSGATASVIRVASSSSGFDQHLSKDFYQLTNFLVFECLTFWRIRIYFFLPMHSLGFFSSKWCQCTKRHHLVWHLLLIWTLNIRARLQFLSLFLLRE